MTNRINHKPYIASGYIIWMASFFGEVSHMQPYSTIGLIISPVLTVFGVFHWFKYYKNTRVHSPQFFKLFKQMFSRMRSNPFAGIDYQFKYFFEFQTFIVLSFMGAVLLGFLALGQSKAFKLSKEYCKSDNEIIEKTGKIKYFSPLIAGHISLNGQCGSAEFSFTAVGEQGNFTIKSELTKSDGEWIANKIRLAE
jgi:hypothetical protein